MTVVKLPVADYHAQRLLRGEGSDRIFNELLSTLREPNVQAQQQSPQAADLMTCHNLCYKCSASPSAPFSMAKLSEMQWQVPILNNAAIPLLTTYQGTSNPTWTFHWVVSSPTIAGLPEPGRYLNPTTEQGASPAAPLPSYAYGSAVSYCAACPDDSERGYRYSNMPAPWDPPNISPSQLCGTVRGLNAIS